MPQPTFMAQPRTASPRSGPPPRRRCIFLLRAVALCVTLVLVWVAAGFWLFVRPPADAPRRADVLLVLGPPDRRMDYAEQLMQQGGAGTLAVSSPVDQSGQFTAPICRATRAYPVTCFRPEPFTTQGEARALEAMSGQYGWHSANILTAQYHVTRAKVVIERCYTGNARMLEYNAHLPLSAWAYQYLYQTAAFVKVALHPEC